MILVETNKSKRVLIISAAGHVSKEEVKKAADQVRQTLQDVGPAARALTDFRCLQSMHVSAAPYIAEIMHALAEKRVASVIRIIPDSGREIGMNILTRFNHGPELPISTVETLAEALDRLVEQKAEADRNGFDRDCM
jgi:hypothetical protein